MPSKKPTDESSKKYEFLVTMRERFKLAQEADKSEREKIADDLRFYDGDQWPEPYKTSRISKKRPCLVINLLPEKVDQVVGDQRQNRPGVKVRAVDKKADKDTAKIFEGIIRGIEYHTDAETSYDTAFENAVICGRGWFGLNVGYIDGNSFDQDIMFRRISNPLCVYSDPNAQDVNLADARYMFITKLITEEAFKRKWPDARMIDFEMIDETSLKDSTTWFLSAGKKLRIVEYWVKVPGYKWIAELEDGAIKEIKETNPQKVNKIEDIDGVKIERRRKIKTDFIWCYLCSGADILEPATLWAGSHIPLIPVWGKEINIDGEVRHRGLVRHAKDPQRMHNFFESHAAEIVALAPKSPWLLTKDQLKGHESIWNSAHEENYPFMLYNHKQGVPPPQRKDPGQIPSGAVERAQANKEAIKSTTGLYDPAIGAPSNETSGIAIRYRQKEGDTATFAYIDNLSRSIKRAGVLLIDLIPKIIDTPRIVRLINPDLSEEQIEVNRPLTEEERASAVEGGMSEDMAAIEKMFDLSVGKYDVRVDVGASYTTQREEAAASMMQFIQYVPDVAPLLLDLIAKNLDWPGAEEMAERAKFLLPPELRAQIRTEESEEEVVEPTEEVSEEGAVPEEEALVMQVKLQQEQEKLRKLKAEADKAEAEAAKIEAELNVDMTKARRISQGARA